VASAWAQSGAIQIEKPFARATAPGAAVGGGYATISNNGPVREGEVATILLSDRKDISPEDQAAGFRYAFDFNNDGTFDASETIFSYTYMYYTSYTYSFAVPGGVSTGTRRMRVLVTSSFWGYYGGSLSGCAGYYYGDSRDYSVTIATPPPSVTATPSSRNFGYVASSSTSASTANSAT
jgi:hypothetical protein